MVLVIQRVRPNHFSKKLLKYIFMKLDFINIWWITLRIKPGTQGLRCSNFQSGSLLHDFVLLRIFYEGVACIIKSWDIIYK